MSKLSTRLLGYATLVLMAASLYGTLVVARADRVQGDAARVVYFHVPMAWAAFLAFAVGAVASVAYLGTGASGWGRLGHAPAQGGGLFTNLVLGTRSIRGHPI